MFNLTPALNCLNFLMSVVESKLGNCCNVLEATPRNFHKYCNIYSQYHCSVLITHVKCYQVLLESCLLRWTDYSESYDKINKWLRDTEKRLRETEPKADLSEKKADLQRLKVFTVYWNAYMNLHELSDNILNCFGRRKQVTFIPRLYRSYLDSSGVKPHCRIFIWLFCNEFSNTEIPFPSWFETEVKLMFIIFPIAGNVPRYCVVWTNDRVHRCEGTRVGHQESRQ